VNDGDTDAGFATRGDAQWVLTDTVGFRGGTHALITTDPSNFGPTDDTGGALWTPNLPYDGIYDVLAYVPFTDTQDIATHFAMYRITHAEGMNLVRRSQHDGVEGWMMLGAYPFVKGALGNVYLGNRTGDEIQRSIFADAMRFVWRSPLIVRPEENEMLYLVLHGRRHFIPDAETFGALRLSRSNIRTLSALQLAQYPEDEPIPSIYTTWVGQYFAAPNFPAAVVRGDDSLNFRWNGSAPAPGMQSEFATRWTRIFALTEGEYAITVEAIGGLRLWVDGKLEIDAWDSANVLIQHQKSIQATSGLHRVEVEYLAKNGWAQIAFGNLPPNMPIILDAAKTVWTQVPTATLQWADAGDADNTNSGRKFFVTVWRDSGVQQAGDVQTTWRTASNWITDTHWTVTLPEDGKYEWSVVATDGVMNSAATPPRTLLLDRTAPWAQMQAAQSNTVSRTEQLAITSTIALQNISGDLRGTEVRSDPNLAPTIVANGIGLPLFQVPLTFTGNLPAIRLTWWATDTLSGIAGVDVQARETVRATTSYTLSTTSQDVTRIGYQLTLSGTVEITEAVVLTETVLFTTVVPVVLYEPITPTDWVTVAVGLVGNDFLFFGNPGSTYEFRVRARDAAGNQQDWYEGYAIAAEIDPKTVIYRVYSPLMRK
jgi:hypothetical protein